MLDLQAALAEVLQVNRSAMPRLLEAFARGGLQGGAPEGDPATPPAPPAAPPAAPPPAAPPAPPTAGAGTVGANVLEYYNSTIGTLTKTIEDMKASGAAKDKDLKQATAALENFQKLEGQRADSLFTTLPEGNRKRLEPFKAQVPQQTWIALLAAEQALVSAAAPPPAGGTPPAPPKPTPPPTGNPLGGAPAGTYDLSERSRQILEQFPDSEGLLERIKTVNTETIPGEDGEPTGALKFFQPVQRMIKSMRLGRRVELKKENAPPVR